MLRRAINCSLKRYYHAKRAPVARVASARVGRIQKQRLDYDARPASKTKFDPTKSFEPFPFAVTEENRLDILNKIVTPLHDIPYEEQLASKESYCRNSLRAFGQELYKAGTPVRLDVRRLPCQVNQIVHPKHIHHYRNKDEFSIWHGLDGKTITAGFNAFPISKHGDTVCVEPNGCVSMKEDTIRLLDVVQEFLRDKATLPVCFDLGSNGGWRRIIIRSNEDHQLMLIGVLSPRGLRVREVLAERDNFRDFVVGRSQELGLKLASLYYQPCPHTACLHKDVPFELLYGEKTLEETIGRFKFVISPESFLHENSEGAGLLCETVINMIDECFSFKETGVKPLIVDAHCGVGVLAVNLAEKASRLIGIDSSSQAISDAQTNVQLNDITNVELINSSVEIVLEKVFEKYSRFRNDTLVICDAPRGGVHRNVIDALRHSKQVRKMIFITPKIDSPKVMSNLLELCSKSRAKSLPPFAPVLATPVDCSPLVESFQTVLALERLPE